MGGRRGGGDKKAALVSSAIVLVLAATLGYAGLYLLRLSEQQAVLPLFAAYAAGATVLLTAALHLVLVSLVNAIGYRRHKAG
jgi:hypothetical protein